MFKYIKDPIYTDYLKFYQDELEFIDHPYFKRLKKIKQLGSLHEVFPSATHTRFEHSLGVAHLGEVFVEHLFRNSNMRLTDSNRRLMRNIKIAGLYHDIGHGPFSHVFDHHVLRHLCPNNPFRDHENRSCLLFETVAKELGSKNFNAYDIDFIKNAIDPSFPHKKNWELNVIANKINSIDVDKFDYLVRDPYHIGFKCSFDHTRLLNKTQIMDGEIYFHETVVNNLYDMYHTRYKFHREVYNHNAVKGVELMIADILLDLNTVYNFPSIIDNPSEFGRLNDNIIEKVYDYNELHVGKKLLDRIERRQLYKEIFRKDGSDVDEVKDYISDNFKDSKETDFHICKMKFDFCNGKKSPFPNINFYKKNKKVPYENLNIRALQPEIFDENVISVYSKK